MRMFQTLFNWFMESSPPLARMIPQKLHLFAESIVCGNEAWRCARFALLQLWASVIHSFDMNIHYTFIRFVTTDEMLSTIDHLETSIDDWLRFIHSDLTQYQYQSCQVWWEPVRFVVLLSTLLKPCASPKRISKNGFRNGTGKASTQLYTAWENTMMISNCGMAGAVR